MTNSHHIYSSKSTNRFGMKSYNICYIASNLSNKKNVEKTIDLNIVFIVIEQYVRNPKNYDFYILENKCNEINDKFILIYPVPFQ